MYDSAMELFPKANASINMTVCKRKLKQTFTIHIIVWYVAPIQKDYCSSAVYGRITFINSN